MLVIHEAGHIVAAVLCGAPVFGVRTRVGGLELLCRAESLSYGRAAFVYAGGAAANLITAALLSEWRTFAAFSVGAASFNLLPLPGSDGENILSSMLSLRFDPDGAARAVRVVTDISVFLFWAVAVYAALVGYGGGEALLFAVALVVYRLGERGF